MERISKFNVARKLETRSLLIAINAVASLSIFFFGYDQGVMGGVNNNRDYAKTMQFGTWDGESVIVQHALLQGGIVSLLFGIMSRHGTLQGIRWLSTIYQELFSAPSSEVGLVIDMGVSTRSLLARFGQSLVQSFNALRKMPTGCSAVSLFHFMLGRLN